MTNTAPTTCPRCGTSTTGAFCSSCGTRVGSIACTGCGAALAADARFCHSCGTPAPNGGAAPMMPQPRASSSPLPWILAAVLCVVVIAGVVYSARSKQEPVGPDMANAGNAAEAGGNGVAVQAPDISNMTPRERFTRLSDRIETAIEARDSNQVFQFFPMAEGAFTQLPDSSRDIDARYHMGMLWAQVGEFPRAIAQADSIQAASPGNLFGYYLHAMVAEFKGDSATAQKARADFVSHYDVEIKKTRPEYRDHAPFLDQYRKSVGAK